MFLKIISLADIPIVLMSSLVTAKKNKLSRGTLTDGKGSCTVDLLVLTSLDQLLFV
jgi:hypothetical protein